NHIGAVLIAEGRELLGIVTDRDLVLEVVATGLDPNTVAVRDVMTTDVTKLPIDASLADLLRTMGERAIRRVPLVEHERVVGIVSLDELLLDGALSLSDAQAVLRAQLEAGTRLKPEGATQPTLPVRTEAAGRALRAEQRRRARAETTYGRLLRAIARQTGII